MQWLQRLSLRALRHRFDKRRLQEEMDMHRLYLLTTYHAQGQPPRVSPATAAARHRHPKGAKLIQTYCTDRRCAGGELLSGSVEELDHAARELGLEVRRSPPPHRPARRVPGGRAPESGLFRCSAGHARGGGCSHCTTGLESVLGAEFCSGGSRRRGMCRSRVCCAGNAAGAGGAAAAARTWCSDGLCPDRIGRPRCTDNCGRGWRSFATSHTARGLTGLPRSQRLHAGGGPVFS